MRVVLRADAAIVGPRETVLVDPTMDQMAVKTRRALMTSMRTQQKIALRLNWREGIKFGNYRWVVDPPDCCIDGPTILRRSECDFNTRRVKIELLKDADAFFQNVALSTYPT